VRDRAPRRYTLIITPTARRQLAQHLPRAVAFAAYEFIVGALLDNPQRVGKRLQAPLDARHSARRGTYRVIYQIDEEVRTVTVVDVTPTGCVPHQPLISGSQSASQ
jgi:mRNA interferase RelE/StbE